MSAAQNKCFSCSTFFSCVAKPLVQKASVRLEDKGPLELAGLSPLAPAPTVYLMLYVLLLDEMQEVG